MNDELAVRDHVSLLLAPVATLEELKAAYKAKNDFIKSVMREDVDFGIIPGTDKPTLYQAGAEKLTNLYGLQTEFVLIESVLDWSGADHAGEPFFYFHYQCLEKKGEVVVSTGEGSCNSWEKKYRYRTADLVCPECGQTTLFKSKNADATGDLGWFCWSKKGGCGANFVSDHPDISGQDRGMVKNPNPFDIVNVVQKMAQKRSHVSSAKTATGTSEYFTQDIEDMDFGSGQIVDVKVVDVTQDSAPKKVSKKAVASQKEPITLNEHELEAVKVLSENIDAEFMPEGAFDWGPAYKWIASDDRYTRNDLLKATTANKGDARLGMAFILGYL